MHSFFMDEVITLAVKGKYHVSPNPKVGCIIVKNGSIIGKGFHEKYGESHAEVNALRNAGNRANGATLYVNLEPCCHFGKTPPCTRAIIDAGITRVVYAMKDPDNRVAGKGSKILKDHGIEVISGVKEKKAIWLNRGYLNRVLLGRPFITYKMAMTLDGVTATHLNDSKWISSEQSRYYVHKMRGYFGNVMVGGDTALFDKPRLTSRIGQNEEINLRIILSKSNDVLNLIEHFSKSPFPTLIFTKRCDEYSLENCPEHITIKCVSGDEQGNLNIKEIVNYLGSSGVNNVICEGGSSLGGSLLSHGLIDEFCIFMAPKFICDDSGLGIFSGLRNGTMAEAKGVGIYRVKMVDKDILIKGYIKEVAKCSPVWSRMLA